MNCTTSLSTMRILSVFSLLLLVILLPTGLTHAEKQRVFVLTDISNEPDDEESMVRFLVYANEYDVEGLVATTSTRTPSLVSYRRAIITIQP